MTQLNISSTRESEVPFRAPKGVMAVEIPQNEEISIIRCHFYYLS